MTKTKFDDYEKRMEEINREFAKLRQERTIEDEEFAPHIVIERVIVHEDQPGVTFYRIRHGSETMFIGSDDSVETATGIEDSERETIRRRFKGYLTSDEGKDNITQVKEEQAKEEN